MKDQHGNLKTVETISEHLALLDFIDELLPSNSKEALGPGSGILELLQFIEDMKEAGRDNLQLEGVIKHYMNQRISTHSSSKSI